MTRATSFRLPDELLDRLTQQANIEGSAASALVASLLDEGLKTRQFPGIVYRNGPAGRRAALAAGPDVWEVIRAVRCESGAGEARLRRVATNSGLDPAQVRAAIDFYSRFPDEVDARIEADEQAAEAARAVIERRERLLAQ